MGSVGAAVRRVDGVAKARGSAKYLDDLVFPGTLHARIFRSGIAAGWVKRLDVAEARAHPGVVAVLTYEDVPGHTFSTAGHPFSLDPARRDVADRRLLTQNIRFYGDEIAAVVAEDEAAAEEALDLIRAEYEERPPALTTGEALEAGAEEIHEGTGNVILKSGYRIGDTRSGFDAADFVLEEGFRTQVVQACAMENHGALAYVDDQNRIVVYSSTQIPHICRRIIGEALGVPWGRIRVIKPCVGGGFGGKQDAVLEPLAAYLATVVRGRPVKLVLAREETFAGTRVRHAMGLRMRTGVSRDGGITAAELEVDSMNGGYASHGHSIAAKCGTLFRQLYRFDSVRFEAVTAYTNTPAAGAMRGYGAPQLNFALESHMDDLALELGIDPVAFRERNLNQTGFVDPVSGLQVHTNGLLECLGKGRERIGWEEKRRRPRDQTGRTRRGVGMACFCYGTGTYPVAAEVAGARIVMNPDGSVQVQVGAAEIGQGSDTVLAQIAAETLGLPVERVHMVSEQDTDITPFDPGAYASRQTYVSGMAVKKAGETIRAKILGWAGRRTGRDAAQMTIEDGWVVHGAARERLLPVSRAALENHYDPDNPCPLTAEVSHHAGSNPLAFGCTFVEVEVDMETGKVAVRHVVNVHDAGRIINPRLAVGQVHGGIQMGLGYGLCEQLLFEPGTGRPLNGNFQDYKMLTAVDMPRMGSEFVQTEEPTGPYGNKALGEPATVSVAAAVRNAILDATGVKLYEIPMTPERLFFALRAAGG